MLHDPVPPDAPPDLVDVLAQVEVVVGALGALGHEALVAPFRLDPAVVRDGCPDVVVNLVETVDGDNTRIHLGAALLEAVGVPFTGAGCAALAVSTHKGLAKRLVAARGVRVPADWPADGPLYVVKPVGEDASVGIDDGSVVPRDQVPSALAARSARFGPCLAETFVDGRELNVSILETADGPVVLPVAEIVFDPTVFADRPRIVGYDAKWDEESPAWAGTPRRFDVDGLDRQAVAAAALVAWEAVGLRGYGRVDMRLDPDGHPVVIEVNANPCLAADAGFLAAAAEAGLGPAEVVSALLAAAVRP